MNANDAELPLLAMSVATGRENAMELNQPVAPVQNDLLKSASGKRDGVPKGGVTGTISPDPREVATYTPSLATWSH